jgi:hypothetical protein
MSHIREYWRHHEEVKQTKHVIKQKCMAHARDILKEQLEECTEGST